MDWFKVDWVSRPYEQRQKLIASGKEQGVEPVKGPSGKWYPPLTGAQAQVVLTGWSDIIKKSTDAAKYVGSERFTNYMQAYRSAYAGALLAGAERMSADDLELVFQTIDDLARALSEAAFVKQEIGDPPTFWEALVYGFKNPGEIPGAVAEGYQDAGADAWNFAKEKVKGAAAAVTPEIPWWAKAAAVTAVALAVLGSIASMRKP